MRPCGCLGTSLVGSSAIEAFFERGVDEDAVLRALAGAGIDGVAAVGWSDLEDPGWVERFNRTLVPRDVGRRFTVIPAEGEAGPGRLALHVAPGRAFGTGQHESTRLALLWLEDLVRPGAVVLDVGTGSGILAAAAARLGASSVHATDVDPEAIEVAAANLARVPERGVVALEAASSVGSLAALADVVVANLQADLALGLLPQLAARLVEGGALVLSGLLDRDEQPIADALARLGHEPAWRREGEWSCSASRRRGPPPA